MLFPILEGVVRDFNGRDKDGVNIEGFKAHENGSFNAPTIDARMKSVNVFLKRYFASVIAPDPVITKRNTLLHGESFAVDKMTCIRLLNWIDSVRSISEILVVCANRVKDYKKN